MEMYVSSGYVDFEQNRYVLIVYIVFQQ